MTRTWWCTTLALCCMLLCWSCKKESFTSSADARLQTSVDSLHFDTVFTTTGSITQVVKIINNNSQGIKLQSVQLAGGNASAFRINVDGIPGPQVNDVAVGANDSVYVFVTVSINPSASNLPFVVQDSIKLQYNGNTQWVQLDAWGRNAQFLRNKVITADETWNNTKPYVILGGLLVSPNVTLTIPAGTKVYMHADAPFLVQGTLMVQGQAHDTARVLFTGDRLDEPYKNYPASFPGLFFLENSKNSVLNYAVIRNAYQAVVALEPSTGTKLTLNETIIEQAYDAGITGINTSITARNLLVSNCGKNVVLVRGGNYNFTHATLAAVSTSFITHKQPVLFVANYTSQNNVITANPLNAVFRNCIFWGESNGLVSSEVNVLRQGTPSYAVVFDNVLWRVPSDPANSTISGTNIRNQDPLFETVDVSNGLYNYRLKTGSPALNKGSNAGVAIDLDGKPRPVGLPDLGAYEKQ